MPNSVGESGAFINPGNPGIIEGIFLLHHHTHHRHAPPGLRRSRPKARTVLAFTPHALVCGVFFGRGVWREARSRHESTLAARPTPPRPSPCQGRERPAGHADVQAGGVTLAERDSPLPRGARGGLAPAPTPSLASPRPPGCLRPGIEGSCHPFLVLSPLRQCPGVGHERYPATLPRVAVPLRCPKTGHKRVSRYPPLPRADPRMAHAGASKGRAAPPLGVHDPSLGLGDPPEGRGGAPLGLGHPPMGVSDPPEGR